jgi:type I restriction enzyme R subunit
VPTTGGCRKPAAELDRLSNIIDVQRPVWEHPVDRRRPGALAHHRDIPNRVAADKAYQNAKKDSDKPNAKIEHDKALARAMTAVPKDGHRAVQTVQRQRVIPALADGYGVFCDLQ